MIKIPSLRYLAQVVRQAFSRPSWHLLCHIIEGWILCPGRRYVVSMMQFGDVAREHSHDAFHRFFRCASWSTMAMWAAWTRFLVRSLRPVGTLWLLGDDTVHKKSGRKVVGAKTCRDAVRSTKTKTVFAWGLQIVLLCLKVQPPWGGEPLALPINMRLYRKKTGAPSDRTILELMAEMINEVADWIPDRPLVFTGDGFYAPLPRIFHGPRIHVISRIRHDAKLFKRLLARTTKGKRGRPRTKGDLLPKLPAMVAAAPRGKWRRVQTMERGRAAERFVAVFHAVWHHVLPGVPLKIVVSRDPDGKQPDNYFFSTDIYTSPGLVVSAFADRWPIEDTFRNVKQHLRIETPQSWKDRGPERVAVVGYLIYGIVWAWFIRHGEHRVHSPPWYPAKAIPSFIDAMAEVRLEIWRSRISATVPDGRQFAEFSEAFIEAMFRAA